jgi:hypothetical protein
MRVNFAYYLIAPFAFAALLVLFLAWEIDSKYAIWMIPCLLGVSFGYVFSPQLNWWWYSKRPPQLETGVVRALEQFSPFYQRLATPAERQRFRDRLALTRMSTDWTPSNMPDDTLPPDLQTAIAAQAVCVTWGQDKFLIEQYEKVVVSPRAFLSPEFPYHHNSELHEADACLIFSARAVLDGFLNPRTHFNVALYEYAKAWAQVNKVSLVVDAEEELWDKLEAASSFSRQQVETTVGLAGLHPQPVAIHHYFNFYPQMQRELPDLVAQMDQLFLNN